jgi:serine/threonine protein kinase
VENQKEVYYGHSKETHPNDSNILHLYNQNESYLEDFFHLQKFRGLGGFGEVQKATNKKTEKTVSLKFIFKKKDKKVSVDVVQEVLIFELFNHFNVVKFYGSYNLTYET